MNSTDPHSSNFSYQKYSLEQLDNWVNDALNCEDLTPQDIYNTIVKCVDESVEYHKKYLTKSTELLSLLKGQQNLSENVKEATNYDWVDFWEENYYPEEYKYSTEEELDAMYDAVWHHTLMCDAVAEQEEKDKCREYNLREAEYYNQRAKLDADDKKSKHYYDTDRNK